MGKNYDNWERLVRAVLLKEELRRLALRHSREPSSSSCSSTSPYEDQELAYNEENKSERMEFLKESVSRLGLKRLNIDEVQRMEWTQLEDEIGKWIKAAKVTIQILFPSDYEDLSFIGIIRGTTIQLLTFGHAVDIGSRAPEWLFKVLDVYATLRVLMPEFELIFSHQYRESFRGEPLTILRRLEEVIRGIFMELENLIRRDPAKPTVPGGGIHSMTRYVMNYLRAACRYRLTLEQAFEENININYGKEDGSLSPLAVQLAWITELLESNLRAKSKIYKDPALSSVFMINNGRYMVEKVKHHELGTLLGDDWIRKHTSNYPSISLNKVLSVLKVDNFNSLSPKEATKSMKDTLSLFNSYFEDICTTQASWVITSEQLREDSSFSVSWTLSPAYRNFIGRVMSASYIQKLADRYIKYSVEDVEARISELFPGEA